MWREGPSEPVYYLFDRPIRGDGSVLEEDRAGAHRQGKLNVVGNQDLRLG